MEPTSTEERVYKICNDLYREGSTPSVRMVLNLMPDISSTSTVHKPFKKWKKELEASQESLYDKLGFSTEFTQSFMREITRFGVEAEARYKTLALEANDQCDQALLDLDIAEERLYKQTAVLQQQEKELKELKQKLAEQGKAREATEREIRQQVGVLKTDNKELSETNESLRTSVAKAELKMEGNTEYVSEVKTNQQAVLAENKNLQQELASLSKNFAGLESTLSGRNELLVQLRHQSEKLEIHTESLEKQRAESNTRLAVIESERDTHKSNWSDAAQSLKDTQQQLQATKSTVQRQQQTLDENQVFIKKYIEDVKPDAK